jgi:serine protease Do
LRGEAEWATNPSSVQADDAPSSGHTAAAGDPTIRDSGRNDTDAGFELALQTQEVPAPKLPAPAATGRGRIGMFSFADIVERVSPAVVTVSSTRQVDAANGDGIFDRFFGNREHPNVEGHGSGFIIGANGIILTNNHVIENANELKVRLQDGREFDAEVVGRDPQTDVAVLRIPADRLPTLTLGDSDRMRVGDWVLAVGSPFRQALETSVTSGIISGKGRGNVGIVDYEEFLQTDAAINPGNSGGPLINLEGDVIGINTAIATRNGGYQGVSFAIPMNFVKPVVQALLDDGRVRRAWLGVQIQDVTPELARGLDLKVPEGVAIIEVHDNTPAEEAGLRNGDVVLSMDHKPTPNSSLFRNRVSLSHPGQRVAFEILRDGDVKQVDVVLGELTSGSSSTTNSTSSSPSAARTCANVSRASVVMSTGSKVIAARPARESWSRSSSNAVARVALRRIRESILMPSASRGRSG